LAREVDAAALEEQRLARDLAALDFATVHAAAAERSPARPARIASRPCPICRGAFGPVLDTVDLMSGSTFLTAHAVEQGELELLQVTSTRHRDDLDTVPPMDAIAVFEALSKAEGFLLGSGDSRFPETGPNRRGWVTIEKQRRPRRHGTQLLRLHATEPAIVARERAAIARHGGGLPSQLETRNPAELLLGEFRGGLAAAVPAQPRRAFEIVIWFRPGATGVLADLSGNQRWGLAQAVREVTGALKLELSVRGLPERYAWRFVGGAGLEPWLEIVTPRGTAVADRPQDWVARLKNHIGVE
jgi:hypothetical protein